MERALLFRRMAALLLCLVMLSGGVLAESATSCETHSWGNDGVCTLCGTNCTHEKTYKTTNTTNFSSMVKVDDKTHSQTYDVIEVEVCEDCGNTEILGTLEAGRTEVSAHYLIDGVCLCGYTVSCEHPSQTTADAYVDEHYEAVDAKTHKRIYVIADRTTCDKCGEETGFVKTDRRAEYEEEHLISEGAAQCSQCGYISEETPECTHESQSTQDVIAEIRYEEIDQDIHNRIEVIAEETVCSNCRQTLSVVETQRTKEATEQHAFNEADECTLCGYVYARECLHEELLNKKTIRTIKDYVQYSAEQHVVYYDEKMTGDCVSCGEPIETLSENVMEFEAHTTDESGVCGHCGHLAICGHEWNEYSICEKCGLVCAHTEWQYQTNESICLDCAYECEHIWLVDSGVCDLCGNTCTHIWNEQDGACDNCGLDCVHRYEDGVCSECGHVCPHNWDLKMGVCADCERVCGHNWDTKTGVCKICSKVCAHQYEKGACSECGYVCPHNMKDGACTYCGLKCVHAWNSETGTCKNCSKTCDHAEGTREKVSSVNPQNFRPLSGTQHTYKVQVAREELCLVCGKVVRGASDAQMQEVIGEHSFDGDTCMLCRYVKEKSSGGNESGGNNERFDATDNKKEEIWTGAICKHLSTTEQTASSGKSYQSLGSAQHSCVWEETVIVVCAKCGEELSESSSQMSSTEKHSYSGGLCACGAADPYAAENKQRVFSGSGTFGADQTRIRNSEAAETAILNAYKTVYKTGMSEEKMEVEYKKLVASLKNNGCNYAALTNVIFTYYQGHAAEFKARFGFEMIDSKTQDFAFDRLMMEMFAFSYYRYEKEYGNARDANNTLIRVKELRRLYNIEGAGESIYLYLNDRGINLSIRTEELNTKDEKNEIQNMKRSLPDDTYPKEREFFAYTIQGAYELSSKTETYSYNNNHTMLVVNKNNTVTTWGKSRAFKNVSATVYRQKIVISEK